MSIHQAIAPTTPLICQPPGFDERAIIARAYTVWLRAILPAQRSDGSAQDGGFEMISGSGWCDGRESAYILGRLMAARYWIETIDVEEAALEDAIRRATAFISRRQHQDGTLDLNGGFTPNEAGFPLPALVEGYSQLSIAAPGLFDSIESPLRLFVKRAAEAVLAGDAYTANHRWTAACAPLAAVHSLWPDERYLAKIEGYLSDGIDCDAQGVWYEERSPNYNIVANNGMMELAHWLGRPEFLDHVVRNLRFTLYATHPNGEADTSFSHRQDRAHTGSPPCSYGQARLVAQLTGEGQFMTLAKSAMTVHQLTTELLPLPFQIDRYPGDLPEPTPLPDQYDLDVPGLHAVRFRDADSSLTLSSDPGNHFYDSVRDTWGGVRRSDDWLHLHHGDVVIQSVHLSLANGMNIQPAKLDRLGLGRWELSGNDPGWTHTLHFRPGKPLLPIRGEQKHRISVRATRGSVAFDLSCEAQHTAISMLNFYIRPGVAFQEGSGDVQSLTSQTHQVLAGGRPLMLRGKYGAIRITGLPVSAHSVTIAHSPAIGSTIPSTCARLSIGLLLPAAINIQLELLRAR